MKSFRKSYPGIVLKVLNDSGSLVVDEIIQKIVDNSYYVKKDDKTPNTKSRNGELNLHQRIRNHVRTARPLMVKGLIKQSAAGKYSITEKGKRHLLANFAETSEKTERPTISNVEIVGDLEAELNRFFPEWYVQGVRQYIVMGPPGTGKTRLAKLMVDSGLLVSGDTPLDYDELLTRYCAFLQFHPSYSYDDFVEGLRPTQSINNELLFEVKRGPFARMCASALNEAVPGELAGNTLDFPTHAIAHLVSCGFEHIELVEMSKGTLLKRHGNVKIESQSSVSHIRLPEEAETGDKKFFLRLKDGLFPIDGDSIAKSFISSEPDDLAYLDEVESNEREVWLLNEDLGVIGQGVLEIKTTSLVSKKMFGTSSETECRFIQPKELHYVVVDEINRANISEVFGELLVQLEYRLGSDMDISVELPGSGERLVVPDNLVLIGLMNHVDRSLAKLDRAFIRRFHLVELLPDPSVLKGVEIQSVDLQVLMEVLNDKLEFVTGGDAGAQIGHSYFIRAKNDATGRALLRTWYFEILPIVMDYCGHSLPEVVSLDLFPGVSARNSNISIYAKTDLQSFFRHLSAVIETHVLSKQKAA